MVLSCVFDGTDFLLRRVISSGGEVVERPTQPYVLQRFVVRRGIFLPFEYFKVNTIVLKLFFKKNRGVFASGVKRSLEENKRGQRQGWVETRQGRRLEYRINVLFMFC